MDREVVRVPVLTEILEKASVPLSPAVKANGFVYVSGTPPFDLVNGGIVGGSVVAQARQCLENMKLILEAAGSSMDKVVKVVVYSTDGSVFRDFNEMYRGYFPHLPPARSFIEVGPWVLDFAIEIECVALA